MFFCIALALCAPGANAGQDEGHATRYTLTDCIRIGLERATALANARRDEKIAEGRIQEAGSPAYPQLGLNAGYTRLDRLTSFDFNGQTMEFGQLDNLNGVLQATQLLYAGGKVQAALKAAKLSRQYASQSTLRVKMELQRDITTSFFDVLLANEVVRVRQASVNHIHDLKTQTELRKSNDMASEFMLLSAKVRLANEIPLLIAATNQLLVAREAFRYLVNLEDGDYELSGEFDYEPRDFDINALFDSGLLYRPEIRQMELLALMLEQDVTAARSAYEPTLSAFAQGTAANSEQGGMSEDSNWTTHWSAGAQLQWDLYDGGRRGGIILQKKMALNKARADLIELHKIVRLEIRVSYLDMVHAQEAIAGMEDNLALADKALAIEKTRFSEGISTYLEFNDANLALSTSRLQYLKALQAHIHAVANLRHASALDVKESRIKP